MSNDKQFARTADEVANLKASMREAWNTPGAAYQEMAEGLRPAVNHLIDLAGIYAGMRVLDVATGTGIAAIEAARRGAQVTGIDFAPDLLEAARDLAARAGVAVNFVSDDAENMAFPDASFDAIISTFGCMFVPRHDAVAYEMARVVKPGGLLALATWQPQGPNYQLMGLTLPYLPPRVIELPSPLDWGLPDYLSELFGDYVADMRHAEGDAPWIVESPAEALDMLFRRSLGPTVYTYRQIDPDTKLAIRADAMALMQENLEPDGSVRLTREYLLTLATRR